MKPTRKTLISTGIVGAVLLGGVTVTAAASAARLHKADTQTTARQSISGNANPPATDRTGRTSRRPVHPDPGVVSEEPTDDPGQVSEHWIDDRVQSVDPLPTPEASIGILGGR